MNKTDRLLAIVLELQGKGKQRAEDLAETFETSKRTIYRDIQALGEAGVPLVSIPGRGYSLMKGYFLPPLSFTTDEATMLLLGSDFMAQNFDAQYRSAAQSASRKIAGVLPEKLRNDVDSLQQSIRFVSAGMRDGTPEATLLQQLRRAIIEHTTVRFHYHTRYASDGKGEENTRDADPYGLAYVRNTWNMLGYCHMRKDIRTFRLDRIEQLELLTKTFQRPPDFKMQIRPVGRTWHHHCQSSIRYRSGTLGTRSPFLLHRCRRRYARRTAGHAQNTPGERDTAMAARLGSPCPRPGTRIAAPEDGGGGTGNDGKSWGGWRPQQEK